MVVRLFVQLQRILRLVIAGVEVEFNGALRSSPTVCAVITSHDGSDDTLVPLNTRDGRPVLMKIEDQAAIM